jgi:integrase
MKLDKWLKEYHALLGETVNGWLLPGKAGQHRSISSIQTVIAAEVDRMIGVRINPHLLRHFAAWLFLKHNPGQYEPVRRILGHRSIATTIAFYTGLEADSAAGRLDDVVLRERRVTHLIATGAFAKRARATGRGKGRL